MPSLFYHPEQLGEAAYTARLYDAMVTELAKQPFDADQFRATARLETGQELVLSDYWTFLHRDERYRSLKETNRRAALFAGESILEAMVDNDADAWICLVKPAHIRPTHNDLTRVLAGGSVPLTEESLIMVDYRQGRVTEPWEHPVARLAVSAMQACLFDARY